MSGGRGSVVRTAHRLLPDARRVITKPFLPGADVHSSDRPRIERLLRGVLAIPDDQAGRLVAGLMEDYGGRHRDYEHVLDEGFQRVETLLGEGCAPSRAHRRLIGAYLTHEYSIEAAAFFNPSVVASPSQGGLEAGELRFVMSVRAVGEGHISSIEFRTGVVGRDGRVAIDAVSTRAITGTRKTHEYDKRLFATKCLEMGGDRTLASRLLNPLPDRFTAAELSRSIEARKGPSSRRVDHTVRLIQWLAASSYIVTYPRDSEIGDRVIFPAGPLESHGMEDARFVRFVDDDRSVMYYGTYTAYDGERVLPQIIATRDFLSFDIAPLNGSSAVNKGMALFPRRLNGRYAMLTRQDAEHLYVALSDDVRLWERGDKLDLPRPPWALVQVGNCGSPVETPEGWLVLIHGVGPMRSYAIGAVLLDLDDPRRVVATMPEPILLPEANERDGYVPNVVYSCGSLVHGDHLVLPYGFSDYGVGIATVSLTELLHRLLTTG